MSNNIIIPTNKVEGDITNCKIEHQQIRVDKRSMWSLKQTTTYISYDVCSKDILQEYTIPQFSGFSVILGLVFIAILLGVAGGVGSTGPN